MGPLGDGLRYEGERRDKEKHKTFAAIVLYQLLCDAEAGEGLSGAAGHKELAAGTCLKAADYSVKSLFLITPEELFPDDSLFSGKERLPINVGVLELLERDKSYGRTGVLQGGKAVPGPSLVGCDQEAVSEPFLGCRYERVNVAFGDR